MSGTYSVGIAHERKFHVTIGLLGMGLDDLPPELPWFPYSLRMEELRFTVDATDGQVRAPDWVAVYGPRLRKDGSPGAERSRLFRRGDNAPSWVFRCVDSATAEIADTPWPELEAS
jgi:hypothetical protein